MTKPLTHFEVMRALTIGIVGVIGSVVLILFAPIESSLLGRISLGVMIVGSAILLFGSGHELARRKAGSQ